jgi:hypothetical protein
MLDVVIGSTVVSEHRNANGQDADNQPETHHQFTFHVTPLGAIPANPFSPCEEKSPAFSAFQAPTESIYHLTGR